MRVVRWLLLLLYVGLLGGLGGLGLSGGEPGPAIILLAVTLVSLALFILGAGHRDLCRPIRRPRLLMPVAAASFMLAGLVGGLTMAFGELFRFRDDNTEGGWWLVWVTLLATWVFWAVLLTVYTRNLQRYHALFYMARLVFAGSVAEMLAAVPSHLIVSRRPGCLVGLATAISILSGLYVMIWSFGPAIFLLFLREGQRREAGETAANDEPPGPHAPFQFSLRTMLSAMLATGVASGLLREFWGRWPAAAVTAWVAMLLLLPLLTANRWGLGTGLVGAVSGIVWAFWGEGLLLAALVLPAGVLGLVLLKLALVPQRLL
jgi:hypothetical protein